MDQIKEPTIEKAHHILRDLTWGEQFEATEMSPSAGNRTLYIYSMKEAVHLLRHGTAGMGLTSGGRGTLCWFKSEDMIEWVRTVLEDDDLAKAMEEAAQKEIFYDQVTDLGRLFDARYTQLKALIGEPLDEDGNEITAEEVPEQAQ